MVVNEVYSWADIKINDVIIPVPSSKYGMFQIKDIRVVASGELDVTYIGIKQEATISLPDWEEVSVVERNKVIVYTKAGLLQNTVKVGSWYIINESYPPCKVVEHDSGNEEEWWHIKNGLTGEYNYLSKEFANRALFRLVPVEQVSNWEKSLEDAERSHCFDPVNKAQHYADKPIETIDVLKNELSQEEFKGFLRGNVLKYVSRYQKKAGVQDLEKAQWYLTKLIEEEK